MAAVVLSTLIDCPLLGVFWFMVAGCVVNKIVGYRYPGA